MSSLLKKSIGALLFSILCLLTIRLVNADIADLIKEYEQKLVGIRQQKNTLSTQIQEMDTQMYLTGLTIQRSEQKIIETQSEIEKLSSKIDNLDSSLETLFKQLRQRAVKQYKIKQPSMFDMLFASDSIDALIKKIKYQKTAKQHSENLYIQAQLAKSSYEEQKVIREQKKQELDQLIRDLEAQKISLKIQQTQKQRLLVDTQNDEQVYQNLLAKAQAEYAAIKGIIAGAGTETKLREVKKGENIASVISGASCNSSGGHLHFIAQQNDAVVSPFSYLKSTDFRNCSGSSCDSGDGDSFNPSGNLDWPLSPPINFNQGYGSTWAVRNTWVGRIYSFHNGIDITGSSNNVYAVADGTLYKGSYAVGCTLSYVKLIHNDSGLTTLYLHVYPL